MPVAAGAVLARKGDGDMQEDMARSENSVFNTRLIERVEEDMKVVDSAGNDVGKVQYVQFGDPEAITTEGNELEKPAGIIGDVAMAFFGDEREPDVAEPKRSQLLRYGFIKVDGPGLLDNDRYIRSDLIADVARDTVTLTVHKDRLVEEA
jgi:hypothetical protein